MTSKNTKTTTTTTTTSTFSRARRDRFQFASSFQFSPWMGLYPTVEQSTRVRELLAVRGYTETCPSCGIRYARVWYGCTPEGAIPWRLVHCRVCQIGTATISPLVPDELSELQRHVAKTLGGVLDAVALAWTGV